MISYVLTILLSAFLLFQLQPLIGKHILPWFGGSPSVWTTCLLFFQVMLLGGYGYAHWVAGWKSRGKQCLVHMLLLAGTLLLIPVIPDEAWKPDGGESPTWHILGLLTVTVGAPYFLLSTTGPLLQAWFCITHLGRSPYRLYAISNAGSLLGLITYPFLFEPLLTWQTQAITWSVAYVVFVLASGWCVMQLARAMPYKQHLSSISQASGLNPALSNCNPAVNSSLANSLDLLRDKLSGTPVKNKDLSPTPGTFKVISWLLMATFGSALLLSSTNQMCQNIASVPFLWILPLCLYLSSFIIAFAERDLYRRLWCMPLLAVSSALACIVLRFGLDVPVPLQIIVYAALLFAGCMICHGELARIKPVSKYLTLFYLAVASGGALGGILVGIASPLLFPSYWEYHIALGGVGALTLAVLLFDPSSKLYNGRPLWAWILLLLAYAGLFTGLVMAVSYEESGSIVGTRSFYGVLHITEWEDNKMGSYREMYHGEVVHGTQYVEYPQRSQATSYYGKGTGIWLAVNEHPQRVAQKRMHIGVVGLGTGTLAALGREVDVIRF